MSGAERMERGLPMQALLVDGRPISFAFAMDHAASPAQTLLGRTTLEACCYVQNAHVAFICGETLVSVLPLSCPVMAPGDCVVL